MRISSTCSTRRARSEGIRQDRDRRGRPHGQRRVGCRQPDAVRKASPRRSASTSKGKGVVGSARGDGRLRQDPSRRNERHAGRAPAEPPRGTHADSDHRKLTAEARRAVPYAGHRQRTRTEFSSTPERPRAAPAFSFPCRRLACTAHPCPNTNDRRGRDDQRERALSESGRREVRHELLPELAHPDGEAGARHRR